MKAIGNFKALEKIVENIGVYDVEQDGGYDFVFGLDLYQVGYIDPKGKYLYKYNEPIWDSPAPEAALINRDTNVAEVFLYKIED